MRKLITVIMVVVGAGFLLPAAPALGDPDDPLPSGVVQLADVAPIPTFAGEGTYSFEEISVWGSFFFFPQFANLPALGSGQYHYVLGPLTGGTPESAVRIGYFTLSSPNGSISGDLECDLHECLWSVSGSQAQFHSNYWWTVSGLFGSHYEEAGFFNRFHEPTLRSVRPPG